jgi:hypothetical protein
MYTVHYVMHASILLPLSDPLGQRAIAVFVKLRTLFIIFCLKGRYNTSTAAL